jgi:hypothetical protein
LIARGLDGFQSATLATFGHMISPVEESGNPV